MTTLSVRLYEWQSLSPKEAPELTGWHFRDDEAARRLADQLTALGRISVLELAQGLNLRATSFVGRFRLGELTVTVEPKLRGAPFLNLLRYAYGLRDLDVRAETADHATRNLGFQDLLVRQLTLEAEELIRRGLHREYVRREEALASPRGRIAFASVAREWQCGRSTLPCIHYPRSQDHVLNRALLAGLAEAISLTTDLDLQVRIRRLIEALREYVALERLSASLLSEAQASTDRRTQAYDSALTVIELLLHGQGVSFQEASQPVQLSGFLFDMNRFFQSLLSRFLHDYLEDYEVEDESRLKEMFEYDPLRNPQHRRSPIQKPDFLARRKGRVVAVLDAKYRDLWDRNLPREMLYQLALYALGGPGMGRRAVILFPTLNAAARDQAVLIREPAAGISRAEVVLRPVNVEELESLLRDKSPQAERRKRELAKFWALGADGVGDVSEKEPA